MKYAKCDQARKRFVENPPIMTAYNGLCAEGRGDIRAWLGVGDERASVGTYPDRKAAMRAVSAAAKAPG